MTGKVFFCCIYRDIIKYLFAHNLPQPPTPSTSYTPVTTHTPPPTQIPQPPTPHHHPHPSTTHIPPTTHHPKPHSFQNYTHSKTTHIHQPHIPSNHPHLMPVHLCTNEYTGSRWPRYMKSINVKKLCCVLFTYLFTDHTLEQEVKMLKRHSWMVGVKMELL